MHAVGICLLVILEFFSARHAAEDDFRKRTSKCSCIDVISDGNLEFQCPPYINEESHTIIHVNRPSKRTKIYCDKIKVLNDTFLPEANLSMVTKLEFLQCPLPRNGFTYIVEKFDLHNLEFLSFTQYDISEPLTAVDLKELRHLKALELNRNGISVLDGEIFKNTPKLSRLSIDENELILNEKMFKNVPNLLFLSVIDNKINHIPKNTFNYLASLKKLYLKANYLKLLQKGSFDSLINLTMLELSLNLIEIIEDQVFDHLKNLKIISLRRNRLRNISRRIFDNCHDIERIDIGENPNVTLIDDVFSNFSQLKYVSLASNALGHISQGLFKSSRNLLRINLSKNRLKIIPSKIFGTLDMLEELHLQHNNLDVIDERLLEHLKNLKEINLSFNKIIRIPPYFLMRNKNLEKFLMSHNQLNFEVSTDPFSSFSSTNLKEVDLSYNNITRYPYNLNGIGTMETIKLQYNNITSITVDRLTNFKTVPVDIDLSFNKIHRIYSIDLKTNRPYYDGQRTTIRIAGNPIYCDCHALNLARYVQENHLPVRDYLILQFDKLECAGPQKLINQSLEEVRMNELTCTLDKNCTTDRSCDCIYRPMDKTMVIDCSRRQLRKIPALNDLSDYPRKYDFLGMNQIEIHLEDNQLERCPGEFDGYQNTSRWFLKGNAIRNITWIPDSLRMLDLRGNKIETVDASALKILNESNLNDLYLGNNPWECNCGLEDFLIYLRDHINQVDMPNIRCNDTKIRLVDLNDKDLCPAETGVFLIFTIVVLFCLLFIISAITLYLRYKKDILIWLYGRGYCLWMVKEEELDKDKIHDAFISFSHKDEEFVTEKLLSVLESGKEPYKLCIHSRDWVPGELIQTQIMNSVRDSRRTIVILSANFLKSIWGIVEFKAAHNEAMREGRARVIIIICGDINMVELDDDLKAYLKTNTYIKWGDPWFWDKLKFALPKRSGRHVVSMKHTNMMQYIDNKFQLIDKQPAHTVSRPVTSWPGALEEKRLTCIA